jgi:hypothetical protein
MGPIRCPETSVNNYHTTPCNNPEDHRFHQHRGGSLKSRRVVYVRRWCLYRLDHHQDGCTQFLRNVKYIYQSPRSHIPDNLNHQHRWGHIILQELVRTSDFLHFCPHTFCNSARKMEHDISLYSFWLTCISTTTIISNSRDILPNIIRNTTSHSFLTQVTKLIHRLTSITGQPSLFYSCPVYHHYDYILIPSAHYKIRGHVTLHCHIRRLRTLL